MINPTQLILPCQIFAVYYNRGTVLKARRLQFQFPMVSVVFFIDIILLAALWPGVNSASNRNEYQAYLLVVMATGAKG
jgi:hypothetical protein